MARRLPRPVQPFLTWLTAQPAAAAPLIERSPLVFVRVALAQTAGGMVMAGLGCHSHDLLALCLLVGGAIFTTAGLGLLQVVVFHHCSHGTVFRSRQMNELVGRLISAVLLFKYFDTYRAEHMQHHSHNKLLTDGDEFSSFVFGTCGLEKGVSKNLLWWRVALNLFNPLYHAHFAVQRVRAAWGSPDRRHNQIGMAVWGGAAAAAAACGELQVFVVAWLLPITVLLQIATTFRILCEHHFPEGELARVRGKDFACHATSGVFAGREPPACSLRSAAGMARWALWWADILVVQVFVRMTILVGDAPCHDFHHRRPASRKWTSYIQARQRDLEAGSPGFGVGYHETWGLLRAVDANLASLACQPAKA